MKTPKRNYDTIVIGAGQAGLATGYYLKQRGRSFAILDAHSRTGDSWRKRWDSLNLFTAAKYNDLPGLRFPAPARHYPSKDEMADYLEAYARHFDLPVYQGIQVQGVSREGETYRVEGDGLRLTARHVIVATGAYGQPRLPAWANELSPDIHQLHSSAYHNSQELPPGDVLVVGAGSSGTQIALDLVAERKVWLAGRYTGHIPRFVLGIDVFGLLVRTLFNVDVATRLGRRILHDMKSKGFPVVDIREKEVIQAGVLRTPRVASVEDGKPLLADGRLVEANVVIWATGFRQDFRWIDLPVFDTYGMPQHRRGVVVGEPGLYFVGLPGLYRGKSPLVVGVGDDARYIVSQIATRAADGQTMAERLKLNQTKVPQAQ